MELFIQVLPALILIIIFLLFFNPDKNQSDTNTSDDTILVKSKSDHYVQKEGKNPLINEPLTKKSNWNDFQKVISDFKIEKLYHFTDKNNIESIQLNGGLYSWDYCEKNNIVINISGGNNLSRQLDSMHGLQDFVRLSFNQVHPMMYVAINDGRIKYPVILEISTEVIFLYKTLYSNKNATDNTAKIGNSIEDFCRIDFTKAKTGIWGNDENDKKLVQAEILVKTKVPLRYILNI